MNFNRLVHPQSSYDYKEYTKTYQVLCTLSNQHNKNLLKYFKKCICINQEKIYPKFKTDSAGNIVSLVTTLNKKEKADICKVREYIEGLINKSPSQLEQARLRKQLFLFERQWKVPRAKQKEPIIPTKKILNSKNRLIFKPKVGRLKRVNSQSDENSVDGQHAIINKLKALGIETKDGKRIQPQQVEYLKNEDNYPYTCTTFITPITHRIIRIFEDAEGLIAIVYLSKKGKGVNNNFKVNSLDGTKIVCRDMASFQIRNLDSQWRDILGNQEKMSSERWLTTHQYDVQQFIRKGNEVYKCSPFNVGEALYALKKNSKNPRTIALMNTINHVMSIQIEKRKKGGILCKFYDPNHSDDILRILTPFTHQLKKLPINALIRNKKEFALYFPKDKLMEKSGRTLSLFLTNYNNPNNPTGNWGNTKIYNLTPKIISNDPTLNQKWYVENLITSMMINGNDLHDIIDKILNSSQSKEVKFHCMKGIIPREDAPMLLPIIADALSEGYLEATRVYVKAVLNYPEFKDEEKYQLLGGLKEGDSSLYKVRSSLLYTAFLYNRKDAVIAFAQAVAEDPYLASNYKVSLLQAQMKGSYGLAITTSEELKEKFTNFILSCNHLSKTEKNHILLT